MRLTASVVATAVVSLTALQSVTAQSRFQAQDDTSDNSIPQTYGKASQNRLQDIGSKAGVQQTGPPVNQKAQDSFSPQGKAVKVSSQYSSSQGSQKSLSQQKSDPDAVSSPNTSQRQIKLGSGSTQRNPQQIKPTQLDLSTLKTPKSKSKPSKDKGFLPGLSKLGVGLPKSKKQGPLHDNTLLGIPLGDKPKSASKKSRKGSSKHAEMDPNASLTDVVKSLFQNFRSPEDFKKRMKKAFEGRASKDSLSSSHFKQHYTMVGKGDGKGKKADEKHETQVEQKAVRSLVERGLLSGLIDEEGPSVFDARDAPLHARWAAPEPNADPAADAEPEAVSEPEAEADPEAFASPYAYADGIADPWADSFEYGSLSHRDIYNAKKQFFKRQVMRALIEKRLAAEEGEEPKKKNKDDDEEKPKEDSKEDKAKDGGSDANPPKAKESTESKEATESKGSTKSEDAKDGDADSKTPNSETESKSKDVKKEGDGEVKAKPEDDKKPQKYKDACDACQKMGLPGFLCKTVKICQ